MFEKNILYQDLKIFFTIFLKVLFFCLNLKSDDIVWHTHLMLLFSYNQVVQWCFKHGKNIQLLKIIQAAR